MRLLKENTQSLCPVCLKTVPARVVAQGPNVFLDHRCPDHGAIRATVEHDAGFYAAAIALSQRTQAEAPPGPPPYLTVFPTCRCNLRCNLCYVPNRHDAIDLSEQEIAGILDRWPHRDVWFAGGEPTVMENLPQIVALARAKGKRPYIVTNGVKLADSRYVAKLVHSGLHGVSLSLNALDRKTLQALDGEDFLDEKLRALSNLKRRLRRFAICFSLVRNVNEAEFGKVLRFTLGQYPFARSFHAECLPGIGRGPDGQGVFLSEMLDLFAAGIGSERSRLVELAAQGKAMLGPYGFAADFRELKGASARTAGLLPAAAMALTKAVGSRRPDIRIRLISGPLRGTVDLQETWSACSTMAAADESAVVELWEYLIRCHGRAWKETA